MRTTAGGFLVGLFAGGALVLGLLAGQGSEGSRSTPAPPTASPKIPITAPQPARPPGVAETFLVVRKSQDPAFGSREAWGEALLVRENVAHLIPLPADVDRTALPVTDGERLYAYATGVRERRLVAFSLDGQEEETISGATPLVEPRGLFSSPNGAFLAFFLDNRETRGTEVWTYDTAARSKRVSVENVERSDLTGPAFSMDGSFLLRAGHQLLRGSPRRARAEVLLTVPSDDIRWEGGMAESSDVSSLILVAEVGDGRTVVSRLLEYPLGGSFPRSRLSVTGQLHILGWVDPDTLIIEGSDGVFALRGLEKTVIPTDHKISSIQVSGDGRMLAYIQEEGAHGEIAVVDLETRARRRIPLPLGSSALAASSTPGAEEELPHYRLVQYLRTVQAFDATDGGSVAVPPDVLLRVVSDQIRVIADAPPREPVTAERVWMTSTPSVVYVDYRVGTILWRRLVQAQERVGQTPAVTVLGVFAPVEGTWVLARGVDLEDGAPTALYEFEPEVEQWVLKPLVEGAVPY